MLTWTRDEYPELPIVAVDGYLGRIKVVGITERPTMQNTQVCCLLPSANLKAGDFEFDDPKHYVIYWGGPTPVDSETLKPKLEAVVREWFRRAGILKVERDETVRTPVGQVSR